MLNTLFSRRYFPYFLMFPSLLLFCSMFIYPVFDALWLSFHNSRGESRIIWVGLHNYERLLQDPMWWNSLFNMCTIFVIQVPIMLVMAMAMAVVLNSSIIKFKVFFRMGFFFPAITSLVAYAIIFSMLLDTRGMLNSILAIFGIEPVIWLLDSIGAKASLIIAITWRWTGYNMVIFLASLQNIPQNLYEAATLDGASKFRQFIHITIPLLKPTILFTTVLSTIGTIQLFDEPMNLTGGGPADATLSPILFLYQVFQSSELGYASTIAYGIVLVVGLFTLIQFRLLRTDH